MTHQQTSVKAYAAMFASAKWTRQEDGSYTWGPYTIRREATTLGINRASNPMWHVYVEGQARRTHRRATLAEAKAAAQRDAANHQARP